MVIEFILFRWDAYFVRELCDSSLIKLLIGCMKVLNPYPCGALWFQSGYKNNWQRRFRYHVLKHNLKSDFLPSNIKVMILWAETECWYYFNTYSLTPNSHPTPTPSPQWYYPNDDYTFACMTYSFVVLNRSQELYTRFPICRVLLCFIPIFTIALVPVK